jgi:dTDP-4-amino-4,6-dideoxygalactose transaminase
MKVSVNVPFLPPQDEYQKLVEGVWNRKWLTNNGPLVQELEASLTDSLGLTHVSCLNNGTTAIQFALRALELSGEIITTPFSYVATTSSLVYERCTPVFVDIDKDTLNIDPEKIEAAISPRTSAILATHVYGNPCDVVRIEEIAEKHDLKVIYDAAHCFGVELNGQSLLNHGDASTISFHATKLFHTIEGGAVVSKSLDVIKKVNKLRNFGHAGPDHFEGVGINGKLSEMHAAMGLANLKYIDSILEKRKRDFELYRANLESSDLQIAISNDENVKHNYSYFPILLQNENECASLGEALLRAGVQSRRYFYPLLSELDYVSKSEGLQIAIQESRRVMCLPLFYDLKEEEITYICGVIKERLAK